MRLRRIHNFKNFYHYSTGNTSQSIWLDDVDCSTSMYNCISDCAGCPSVEYHNCDHYQDVTVECSMLNTILFLVASFISLAILSHHTEASTTTTTCDYEG